MQTTFQLPFGGHLTSFHVLPDQYDPIPKEDDDLPLFSLNIVHLRSAGTSIHRMRKRIQTWQLSMLSWERVHRTSEQRPTRRVLSKLLSLCCKTPDASQAIDALVLTKMQILTCLQGQGNDALKRGVQLKKRFYLREAVDLYTKGLDMGATLPELLSILHSNRAHAHSVLGNWRNALQDSQKAVQLDSGNLKVFLQPSPCSSHCALHMLRCECHASAKARLRILYSNIMLASWTAKAHLR